MNNLKRVKSAILAVVITTIGTFNAMAQDHDNSKAPHGGKVEEAGAYHIEALTKDNKVSFFLLDGKAKAMSNKGVTGSVLLQFADGKTKTVVLTASGSDGFDAKDAQAATYTKAIVTFKVKGKTVSAKFSTTAKKETHHHEEGEEHNHKH
ncbi:MAG: hypothetical protein ACOVMG_05590 [Flavobacterium sp.]